MDFLKLKTTECEAEEMIVLHPTKWTETDSSIYLYGVDSDVYKKTFRKLNQKRVDRVKKNKSISVEEIEDDALYLLASCTKSWKKVEEAGQNLECTFKNAKQLYKDYPWIKEQVDEFIGDRNNFLPDSSKS